LTDTRSRLVQCFSAVFPNLTEAEIPRASMTSVGSWDSLSSVTLISVIEEEFGVEIAPEELELFVSFDLILDYLIDQEETSAS
jgi:acyl carrier protein